MITSPSTQAAYEIGNGSVILRATAHIEYEGSGKKKAASKGRRRTSSALEPADDDAAAGSSSGKCLIVFTEMPYQVCKVRHGT